jgi:hypothetical protein
MKKIASRCWKGCDSIAITKKELLGGLVILWNPSMIVLDNFLTTRHIISANFKEIGSTTRGIITNVYGTNAMPSKLDFFKMLQNIGEAIGHDP